MRLIKQTGHLIMLDSFSDRLCLSCLSCFIHWTLPLTHGESSHVTERLESHDQRRAQDHKNKERNSFMLRPQLNLEIQCDQMILENSSWTSPPVFTYTSGWEKLQKTPVTEISQELRPVWDKCYRKTHQTDSQAPFRLLQASLFIPFLNKKCTFLKGF